MTERTRRLVRIGFGLLIWSGLIATIVAGWDTARAAVVEAGPFIAVAIPLILVGLMGGAMGWSVLQPATTRRRAFAAFLAAQPAKYLPGGGAFQLIGQIGLTSTSRDDHSRVGVAFFVHAFVQICAACWVGLLLWLSPDGIEPWVLAVTAVAVMGASTLLRDRPLEAGVRLTQRFTRRLDLGGKVPTTAILWRSWGWTLAPLLLSGAAFAGLAGQWNSITATLATMGAFASAWVLGFVVLPLPSGLGIRELALVGLLPAIPAPQVIATSVLHRLSTLAAELLLLLFVSRRVFAGSRES